MSNSELNLTEKCNVDDLCNLSKVLANLTVSDADNDLLNYDKLTNPRRLQYKSPDMVLEYIEAINKLDDGVILSGEFDEIKRRCFELKKSIDTYVNHVCDRNLRNELTITKYTFDKQNQTQKVSD